MILLRGIKATRFQNDEFVIFSGFCALLEFVASLEYYIFEISLSKDIIDDADNEFR